MLDASYYMVSLKDILKEIRIELRTKGKIREDAQLEMRRTISLSKQTILMIHQKEFQRAQKNNEKVKKNVLKLHDIASKCPDIIYGGLFSAALQEYSEANIFLNLVSSTKFVTPIEMNVPSIEYVLGLADVIGEYRRMTLDFLREGRVEKAENCLELMDKIFNELITMNESYILVPGLRRKCDVARKIIEVTRGDVTQEARRNILEKQLKRMEKLVKNKSTFS
jgi:translin